MSVDDKLSVYGRCREGCSLFHIPGQQVRNEDHVFQSMGSPVLTENILVEMSVTMRHEHECWPGQFVSSTLLCGVSAIYSRTGEQVTLFSAKQVSPRSSRNFTSSSENTGS